MHESSILAQPAFARDWQPVLPVGTMRAVVLHWTAGDYATVYPAYHLCLSGESDVRVHVTADIRGNMRDVRVDDLPYAAHTAGRNSFAVGVAICAMRDARPQAFGPYPITTAQIDALCTVTARVIRHYGIPLGAVQTHAEAAVADGYFGAGGDDERWDIARLSPSPEPLRVHEARVTGDYLRARIGAVR